MSLEGGTSRPLIPPAGMRPAFAARDGQLARLKSCSALALLAAGLPLSGCYLGAQQMLDDRWPGDGQYTAIGLGLIHPSEGSRATMGQGQLSLADEMMAEISVGLAWSLGGGTWPALSGDWERFWYAGCGLTAISFAHEEREGWTGGCYGAMGFAARGGRGHLAVECRLTMTPDFTGDLSEFNATSVTLMLVLKPKSWGLLGLPP